MDRKYVQQALSYRQCICLQTIASFSVTEPLKQSFKYFGYDSQSPSSIVCTLYRDKISEDACSHHIQNEIQLCHIEIVKSENVRKLRKDDRLHKYRHEEVVPSIKKNLDRVLA